jgi:hypothetical protein
VISLHEDSQVSGGLTVWADDPKRGESARDRFSALRYLRLEGHIGSITTLLQLFSSSPIIPLYLNLINYGYSSLLDR